MSRLSSAVRRLLKKTGGVGLNAIINPEISNDEFQIAISRISADPRVRTILEIGASSGEGSTAGLAQGMKRNPSKPQLYAIELSKPRFQKLVALYRKRTDIHCFNVASVAASETLSEPEVISFYEAQKTILPFFQHFDQADLLGWLRDANAYIRDNDVMTGGIEKIKLQTGIEIFDFVLIDGGPFTGKAELAKIYGAKFIALDDIFDIKNFDNHRELIRDPSYDLVVFSKNLRNGFSIFERKN